MSAWIESSSQNFVARHEERDEDDVGAVLGLLEDTRERLEPLFGDAAARRGHGRAAREPLELDLAQPLLPVVRRLTAPAARRYLAGWTGGSALHVLAPRLLAARAANVEGSREMLLLTPAALYVQLVVAECNRALPPPWSARSTLARREVGLAHRRRRRSGSPARPRTPGRRSRGDCARASAPTSRLRCATRRCSAAR